MSDLERTTVVKTMFEYENKFKQLLNVINDLNAKMKEYIDGFTVQEKRQYKNLPAERKYNVEMKEIQRLHRELLNKLYNTENERDIHDLINELDGVSNNNAYSIHKHYNLGEKYDKYLIPYLKQMKLFKNNSIRQWNYKFIRDKDDYYNKPFLYIDELYKFLIYKICLHFLKYRKYILNPYYQHYDNPEMILKQRLHFLLSLFPDDEDGFAYCDPNIPIGVSYLNYNNNNHNNNNHNNHNINENDEDDSENDSENDSEDEDYDEDEYEDDEYINCNEDAIEDHLDGILKYHIHHDTDKLKVQEHYNYMQYKPYFNEFKNGFNINLLNSTTEIANSKLQGNVDLAKTIAEMSGYIVDNNKYIKHKKLIEKTNENLATLVKQRKAAEKIQNAYKKHTLKRKPKSLPHLNALSAPTPVPPSNESKKNRFIRTLSAASAGLRERTSRLVNRLRGETERNRQLEETQNPMLEEPRKGGRKQKTRKNKRRKT